MIRANLQRVKISSLSKIKLDFNKRLHLNSTAGKKCKTECHDGKIYGELARVFFCLFVCFLFFVFAFSRATHVAYGGSQAKGLIRAVAAGLYHSHSNGGSKPRLRPTPPLMSMPDL